MSGVEPPHRISQEGRFDKTARSVDSMALKSNGSLKGALDGIKILEWCHWQVGPFATAFLGDLGPEIIKIEEPGMGDPGRGMRRTIGTPIPALAGGRNYYFEVNNKNKRGITINHRHHKGRELVYSLVKDVDVFVHNFRRPVPRRLGLDFGTLSKYNPKLVYASASGFGPKGPDSDKPGLDYAGAARSGLMSLMGSADGSPGSPPIGLSDQMAAIMLAMAILAGLRARDRYGVGQEVSVSHLGSLICLLGLPISWYLFGGFSLPKMPKREAAANPLWNYYRCSDDKWLCLSMMQSQRYWSDFCRALGIQQLESDPRFSTEEVRVQNCKELNSIIDRIFASKPRVEWLKILEEKGDFICAPVNTEADLVMDPQVIENEYITGFHHPALGEVKVVGCPITFSRTPAAHQRAAPEVGEHTEEILLERGFTWDEIAALKEEGVI